MGANTSEIAIHPAAATTYAAARNRIINERNVVDMIRQKQL